MSEKPIGRCVIKGNQFDPEFNASIIKVVGSVFTVKYNHCEAVFLREHLNDVELFNPALQSPPSQE